MSNTAKARRTAQRHTEPIDTPKLTIEHCTALQRDEIQLHQPEHRHKLSQPGKHHRTLIQSHPWGQTAQPRQMTNLRTFFFLLFLFILPTFFNLHISILGYCGVILSFFLLQPLWRTVWRVLKKLEIELPYDPAISLLGIHTEETITERNTCIPMFMSSLFIIARTWKQPRCPSADKWIRKLWYIYTMGYLERIHLNQF